MDKRQADSDFQATDILNTHRDLYLLQNEMKEDREFKRLCLEHGLPWDFEAGYEPRWYNGPAPSEVQLLLVMAEPGPIGANEAKNLGVAINHEDWIGDYDLRNLEHYWRAHLFEFCSYVWPDTTKKMMHQHFGGTCSFWMSLPPGSATDTVPSSITKYFNNRYLSRLLSLFPNATIVASGGKARDRLKKLGCEFEYCWAFTRPGCNRAEARQSWREVGKKVHALLAG